MLLIFDLDDTLIDTSGSITPFKMRQALEKIVQEGAAIEDKDRAYQDLLLMNEGAKTSSEALEKFITLYEIDSLFLQSAIASLSEPLPNDIPVLPLQGAKEVLLKFYKEGYQLALVTFGVDVYQLQKLEKAGIDRAIFRKIVITQDRDKGGAYKALIDSLNMNFTDTIVIGDRIETDLIPAKRLGCSVIQVVHGRGARMAKESKESTLYRVCLLSQLPELVEKIKKEIGNDYS